MTLFSFLQRISAAKYRATYTAKNRDKINLARRKRYRRQKVALSTKKEQRARTQNAYYYRNHDKCKEYQCNYAKANYRKNRERILARKRLKRLSQKTDCKTPKMKKIELDLNTCQSIPLIVACNARPEDKLSAIVNLL